MRRSRLRLAAACAALVIAACTDQNTTSPVRPTRPSAAKAPADRAALEAQINGLINALYAPTDQGRVFSSFVRVKALGSGVAGGISTTPVEVPTPF